MQKTLIVVNILTLLPLTSVNGVNMSQDNISEEYSQYWQTVIETMGDGLMVVDSDGVIVSVNPAMAKLTGYEPDELVGNSCRMLNCDSCTYSRNAADGVHCELFRDGQIRRCKCTLRRRDGSPLHVMKNAAVIKDGQGNFLGGVETVTDLSEVKAKERELADLRREMAIESEFEGLVGRSPQMLALFNLVRSAAESDAPVLIQGESGTGKEMIANALHRLGPRAAGPFIKVNCASLNESLLESELFGHVKGAFTGADKTRQGRFEAAAGGDFMLDEVGDLPPHTQVKLLRVLQEKIIEKVGDHMPVPVDVRIISATNKDLMTLVGEGVFREDLFYRVAVIPIRVPSLRERRGDIPLLVETFVTRIAKRTGKAISGVSRAAMNILENYHWPGNVRELINVVEYAFVVCPGGVIQPEHLPESLGPVLNGSCALPVSSPAPGRLVDERGRIIEALRATGGRKQAAADMLGISRVTLWKRINKYGIEVDSVVR